MAAKDKRENDSQQRHSEALQRERDKRDRGVAIQNEQHLLALENLRRKFDREWHTVTGGLQKQLGQYNFKSCNVNCGKSVELDMRKK